MSKKNSIEVMGSRFARPGAIAQRADQAQTDHVDVHAAAAQGRSATLCRRM